MARTGLGRVMSRPLSARLAALATMLVFLGAQPWVICPPLCLVDGHAPSHRGSAMAGAHHRSYGTPCHTGKVVPSEVTASGFLSIMLPAPWAPALPSLSVVTVPIAPPL